MSKNLHCESAFIAANNLQDKLVTALEVYFEDFNFDILQHNWSDAIDEASIELVKYKDWKTILLNLALVVFSIPLLGLPMAFRYWYTGYKQVFFQTPVMRQLEKMEFTSLNSSSFVDLSQPSVGLVFT